jgi:hypothetical protein
VHHFLGGAPVARRRTTSSAAHYFLGGAPVARRRTRCNRCADAKLVREPPTGAGRRPPQRRTTCPGVSTPPNRHSRTTSSAAHHLLGGAPITRPRTRCNRCADAKLVREPPTVREAAHHNAVRHIPRARHRRPGTPAPLPRRRTNYSAAHPMQPVRGRGTGARTTNWCGKTPATTPYDPPGSQRRRPGNPAPLPRRRTTSSAPHHFLGGAPLTRRRTRCNRCADAKLVREPPTGAGRRRPRRRTTCPRGLNAAGAALPHHFFGGALLPRRRTTSSAAHPMQLVRGRQTGARPTNWCANDKLVRQGGRGCPQAAR